MDATSILYLQRIDMHLAFIIFIIFSAIIYYFGSKLIKFVIKKVKSNYVRIRKPGDHPTKFDTP